MMKKVAGGIFLLFLILASVWIVFGRGGAKLQTSEGAIFGTTYHIKYEFSENLDTAILAELDVWTQVFLYLTHRVPYRV